MEEIENPQQGAANIASKIISIAAGEAHTLALTGDGKVYTWGRGTFGRLGTGSEEDRHFPARVTFFDDNDCEEKLKIVAIAAGSYHSLALADDGSVWGWGYNIYGQIGVTGENRLTPHLVEGFVGLGLPGSSIQDQESNVEKPLKVSSIKAGGMMSLAIDNHGSLWMWGNCPHPSPNNSLDTEYSLITTASPLPVSNFHFNGHTVVKVACGNEHVIALVSTKEETHEDGNNLICYSWGGNSHGQLGLGDKVSRSNPNIIETFNIDSPLEVYDIACGAFHTALLAKQKKPSETSESLCLTFGLGDNGQLGHGTTQSLSAPEIVRDLPEGIFLVSIDCGLFHTSVVTSVGEVFSWGMEKGLGLCPDARFTGPDAGDALSPILIPRNGLHDRKFPEALQVACGGAHTVLVGENGFRAWSWGRGLSGVLGNGGTHDCYSPSLVLWPLILNNAAVENECSVDSNLEIEMNLLRSKLLVMERYASVLHGSIFGKAFREEDIPVSLQNCDTFDIGKEWENILESSDQRRLARLEMFYRDMLAGVKDKLMKRRIHEIVQECLKSNTRQN